mgnify:CR=1 FL=1
MTHDQEEALSISDRIVVMRHGKIEQEGSPTDLYCYPSTLFVATFVGSSVVFYGQLVVHQSGGTSEVDVGGFRVVVTPDSAEASGKTARNLVEGDNVAVVVRPEHVEVLLDSENPPPLWNSFDGIIEVVTYQGNSATVHVRLKNIENNGSNVEAVVEPVRLKDLTPGTHVKVSFAPENARIVLDEGR